MPISRGFIAAAIAALLAAGGLALSRSSGRRPPTVPTPLGDTLPWLVLQTTNGTQINLHDRIAGRPALIYVMNPTECAGCSNLPLEFRIVRGEAPQVRTLLIGSGGSAADFRPFLQATNMDEATLIDPSRTFLHAIHLTAEPVAILVDSTGRVLVVDSRSTSRAAQYPMGRIIHDLAGVLGGVHAGAP